MNNTNTILSPDGKGREFGKDVKCVVCKERMRLNDREVCISCYSKRPEKWKVKFKRGWKR
jgi:hypothetical protein